MFRLWAREFKNNKMLRDITVCNDKDDTRTHKVFDAMDEICSAFDLAKPLWLDNIVEDFRLHATARFYQDSFIEPVEFDFLEIRVIEEDDQ
ncbi:MAG: hypothetical protein K6B28_01105 [Lachnospiraceae bacterium]|nr:hypothetical protein [Lachnospiraceae bacterium]